MRFMLVSADIYVPPTHHTFHWPLPRRQTGGSLCPAYCDHRFAVYRLPLPAIFWCHTREPPAL